MYWFGSRLTIEQARELAPHNSATSLQVAAGILGGMVWALPYLGEVAGVYGDWTPLKERCQLFEEPEDSEDPWQFLNFRVN